MIGALIAAAGLLIGAGIAKLISPHGTARALGHARPTAVRVGAAGEVVVGIAALVHGGTAAWLVAASYVAFAGYVVVAMARGWDPSSCGCFGETGAEATAAPLTLLHVVVDLALAAAAAAAAASRAPGPLVAHPGIFGVQVGEGAVIAGLAYLVLARLPHLQVRP